MDIAAINSRTLVNTMKNRAMSREYLTTRPVNTWAQDVIYLDGIIEWMDLCLLHIMKMEY